MANALAPMCESPQVSLVADVAGDDEGDGSAAGVGVGVEVAVGAATAVGAADGDGLLEAE